MVFLYIVGFHKSWEGFKYFGGVHHHPHVRNRPKKNTPPPPPIKMKIFPIKAKIQSRKGKGGGGSTFLKMPLGQMRKWRQFEILMIINEI